MSPVVPQQPGSPKVGVIFNPRSHRNRQAVDAAHEMEKGETKAKRLQELRDAARDVTQRLTLHKEFAENAAFTQLVTDATELKEKFAVPSEFSDLMKVSHDEIVEQKKGMLQPRKTFYQQHKTKLERDTLGYLWKW